MYIHTQRRVRHGSNYQSVSTEDEKNVCKLRQLCKLEQVCAAEMAVRYAALCASRKVHT